LIDDAQAPALLVDGQDATTTATRTVHDAATGEPIAEVADATAADAERAVAAARAAFRRGDWSRITPGEPRKEWYDAVSSPETP
jgi:acyl-CoA reductase-like NAD-dependent aldehyde dehydrogenase